MRRKTDSDIVHENRGLIILSIILIIFGISCIILPHIKPHVGYDSLQPKEVTITAFKHHYGYKNSDYDYIRTTDGEKYYLSGDYRETQLKGLLTEGKTVIIKWYKNKPFWNLLAEEMYVDGERVVTYNNDGPIDRVSPLIFGIFFIALGAGGFVMFRYFLKANRIKQKKRDDKLQRKYGSKK